MEKFHPKKHTKAPIAILGAGSWGTAVAIHLAKAGFPILLWSHDSKQIQAMRQSRVNAGYLPGIALPPLLEVTDDFDACVHLAKDVILAVPSHAFSPVLERFNKKPGRGIAWLTKGLNPENNHFLSTVVAEKWGSDYPIAIISGPSFAKEVANGLPTAIVVAGNHQAFTHAMRMQLHFDTLRAYESTDIIGVQWCGAVKNIIAIACGISDGLQYGANAKAALITRGLAEMSRMGLCVGGRQETFMGLAGVGDLVLTCTDDQSRNRRFGLALGQGKPTHDAETSIGQVVEGAHNAAQVCALARKSGIHVPICEQVLALLEGTITPQQAVTNLMNRPAGVE